MDQKPLPLSVHPSPFWPRALSYVHCSCFWQSATSAFWLAETLTILLSDWSSNWSNLGPGWSERNCTRFLLLGGRANGVSGPSTGWMPLSSISDHVFCWSHADQICWISPVKLLSYTGPSLGPAQLQRWPTRKYWFARREIRTSPVWANRNCANVNLNLVSQNVISSLYQFQIWMSHCALIFERWVLTPVRGIFLLGMIHGSVRGGSPQPEKLDNNFCTKY